MSSPDRTIPLLGPFLTRLGLALSHPAAFVAAFVYMMAWMSLKPETFEWHAGATMAALFMTLFIQRATHRDTQALHAKIDELLHATRAARDELATVDEEEPEEIEEHRQHEHSKARRSGTQ